MICRLNKSGSSSDGGGDDDDGTSSSSSSSCCCFCCCSNSFCLAENRDIERVMITKRQVGQAVRSHLQRKYTRFLPAKMFPCGR